MGTFEVIYDNPYIYFASVVYTLVFASLHWLPIHFRIQFKILLFVFKALNDQAPVYLTDLLTPLPPSRVRSADRALLSISHSRLKTKEIFRFSWNQLPLDIRLAPSIYIFKSN